jgi:hypothetical protein
VTDAPRPPDVHAAPMFLCSSRKGASVVVTHLHCASCGWWGSEPEEGETLDLFAQPVHDNTDCARRQLDPDYRHAQDRERHRAAGHGTDTTSE